MHVILGFTQITYPRNKTTYFERIDIFSRLKCSEDIFVEWAPSGSYIFQNMCLNILKIAKTVYRGV